MEKINTDTVTLSGLNDREFTVGFPSNSSDTYSDKGALPVGFKVVGNKVYKFVLSDKDQVDSPETKGQLVVNLDSDGTVTWLQDHDLDDQYQQLDTVQSKIVGGSTDHDKGVAILQAIQQHMLGSLNVNSYDVYALTLDEIADSFDGDGETETATETATQTQKPAPAPTVTETETQTQNPTPAPTVTETETQTQAQK